MDSELREAIRRKDVPGVIRAHLRVGILSQAALERCIRLGCERIIEYTRESELGHLTYSHPLAGMRCSYPMKDQYLALAPWVSDLQEIDAWEWSCASLRRWEIARHKRTALRLPPAWSNATGALWHLGAMILHDRVEAYAYARQHFSALAGYNVNLGPMPDSIRDLLVSLDLHPLVRNPTYFARRCTEAVARTWYYNEPLNHWDHIIHLQRYTAHVEDCVALRMEALKDLGWRSLPRETRRILESFKN